MRAADRKFQTYLALSVGIAGSNRPIQIAVAWECIASRMGRPFEGRPVVNRSAGR
jgi:hypothetical protein